MAFHRLLFYADSPGTPWPTNAGEHTVFAVRFRTASGLDLTEAPFAADRDRWTHRTDYATCQDLADAAREARVDVLRYASARAAGGVNLALLSCRTFRTRDPLDRQTWRIYIGGHGARALCDFPEARREFDRRSFAADPRIAALKWER
jgi:hypothetical protein